MQVRLVRPWAVFWVGAAMAGGGAAQSAGAESDAPPPVPGQVMSDVQPLPAEDRDSAGALLLHDSRVRAQRGEASGAAGWRGPVSSIGRGVSRLLAGERVQADLADARALELQRLRREGAGSLAPR
ncbi:MAG TPA: hypothetical protein VFE82_02965 [Ramlibacter sp.]|jgi:hypothetical protein|uniref:hypothetical protein n=1 Tax=Ramlibacter sp. TaxID=1917967 RepID=UPI002D3DCDA5|nr:hypothetical protein [Ramlibacter sp.]HZY17411.1 hypothetical protein [Ramlibacter sp.]